MKIDRILPFLWLKQESIEELEKELKAMLEMGITSFCVESRVHEDFCGEHWFEEMDFIMEFARSHNMKVWLLDDKSYPTGCANERLKNSGVFMRARRVKALRTDICGYRSDIRVRIDLKQEFNENILAVYLAKRGHDYTCLESPVDITEQVHGEYVYLDVEDGYYSVITIVETSDHYERCGFIDMMDPDSVKELIHAVYEPHYERYKEYFGNVFCGFFSDEPRFNCTVYRGNSIAHGYDGKIGKYGVAYPWNEEVHAAIGSDSSVLALWFDIGEQTADIRCNYMEMITDCYVKNFVTQLGDWCRERGVLYTGHIIEDMDCHTSVLHSAGHFFKSMKGADISSVDVVLHQIRSMENEGIHSAITSAGYSDANFFNYTLMKLASSDAHIDSQKQGRALGELFGAYGWGESVSEMIYLTNHALVRGINYFIPHAFTSEFDNKDCPPHFYAGGLNPSNKSYRLLFDYMNRVSGLFVEGKPIIEVAVLYHAQTEWAGGKFDYCDVIAKELMEHQVDFDFVDFEALSESEVSDDNIVIGENRYKLLIIPYYEKLPALYQTILDRLQTKIVYAPQGGAGIGASVKARLGYTHESHQHLRVMRYRQGDKLRIMFLNEGQHPVSVKMREYVNAGECGAYANDYLTETYLPVTDEAIEIAPLQAYIVEDEKHGSNCANEQLYKITPSADVFLQRYNEQEYRFYRSAKTPFFNINGYEEQTDFAGFVKIVPHIDWSNVSCLHIEYDAEFCDLHIGNQVYQSIGGKLFCELSKEQELNEPPYIVLGSSLANVLKDEFSTCGFYSPCKLSSISVKE